MKRYDLNGCAVELETPVEVGRAPGHHWFSTLHPFADVRLVCEVVLADDKGQGQWPATLYLSEDAGATWRRGPDIPSYGPISLSRGPNERLLMPYEVWPLKPGDKRNATAPGHNLRWTGDTISVEPVPVRFLDFPRDLAPYNNDELSLVTNGNILPLDDGRLFTTVYGIFDGDGKYSLPAMTSDDGGLTWRFLSIVADYTMTGDTPEGPCESHTARLADGRLLCVYRTGGHDHCLYQSIGDHTGVTWTRAEPMPETFWVEPQLVRLENGLSVLTAGRPGVYMWVCTDGEGKAWQQVDLCAHHDAFITEPAVQFGEARDTTAYTGMIAVGPDEVMVCYDRLAKGWEGGPNDRGELDAVFCVRARISPR